MPQFTSKVQHRSYEKGEFSEEKERSLAETLELINTFPWDNERTLTVIQLTGPSITMVDDTVNYLKVGLYFGGKFCLYYLDHDNHLYEYHTAEMATVDQLVTDFFAGTLNLTSFEKHLLSIGSKAHFQTAYFEYRPSTWTTFALGTFLILYGLFFIGGISTIIFKLAHGALSLLAVIPLAIYCYFVFRIFQNIYLNRDSYLQISRGADEFSFGNTEDTVKVYRKSEIKKIICYGKPTSSKYNASMGFTEITFQNEECIKISGMLINSMYLQSKFQDNMDNATIHFTYNNRNLFSGSKN